MHVAPYACDPAASRGRRFREVAAPTRTEYQRDRDRIVHSTAFRRLVYKTQVFLNHEGDLFRTRLTHSLEVAQLGRSIARTLQLNEDLVEAIALAHDLGHTPFGHAGQDALHECMSSSGGFEHNLQSLRVVDRLEERYPTHDGLNLTFETREGILKHCSASNAHILESAEHAYADGGGGVGARFINKTRPSLEAQLCNLADEIAYNAHDVDDGVRSGLVTLAQLQEVPMFSQHCTSVLRDHPHLGQNENAKRLLYETIRCMLSSQVYDVIQTTQDAIRDSGVTSLHEVRSVPVLVQFSTDLKAQSKALKSFLFEKLYRHEQVMQTMALAKQVVGELFDTYLQAPHEIPESRALQVEQSSGTADLESVSPQRRVADYIAGMTDRFAMREHERLTGKKLLA